MNRYLRTISGWLSMLACLGLLTLSGAAFAVADENLGPGDSIRITVFDNPDLTTETRISPRGFIRFPLLGNIKLGGMTPAAAGEYIADQLNKGAYVIKPQVNLSVTQLRSRQISVFGQVVRPGRYALDETTTTLADMIALAGGISPTGDDVVTVVRAREGKTEKFEVNVPQMYRTGDMSANIEVESGDTIFVRRAPVFYIYGQIQRAGTYRLESEMTVIQALTLGGGISERGTERGIKVARRSADGKLAKYDIQLADPVKPDDIIHVQESFF